MIVPQERGELQEFEPELRDLDKAPEIAHEWQEWAESRKEFLKCLESGCSTETWQKHYFRGTTLGGTRVDGHQTQLKLKDFKSLGYISSLG
jgi:hypothetical protein